MLITRHTRDGVPTRLSEADVPATLAEPTRSLKPPIGKPGKLARPRRRPTARRLKVRTVRRKA